MAHGTHFFGKLITSLVIVAGQAVTWQPGVTHNDPPRLQFFKELSSREGKAVNQLVDRERFSLFRFLDVSGDSLRSALAFALVLHSSPDYSQQIPQPLAEVYGVVFPAIKAGFRYPF